MASSSSVHDDVRDYYGKTLTSSSDLKTTACCTRSNKPPSKRVTAALSKVHAEVLNKYYGCGLVFPEAIEGCKILDLGCGAGRDCYIMSQLVGPNGFVTGIDMTKEQIDVANSNIDYHTSLCGYQSPNVAFVEGYIESLDKCGILSESIDIIISNCVINLCPNKHDVLKGAYNVLKQGGEMYFSDIYINQPLSTEAKNDKVLHGECIAGALEWKELMDIAVKIGFAPPVLVDVSPVSVLEPEFKPLLEDCKFCSATYRLFKIETATDPPNTPFVETVYQGTIEDFPDHFRLSYDIILMKGSPAVLHTSVAQLLRNSRLQNHFTFATSELTSPYPELEKFVNVNPFEAINIISGNLNKLPTETNNTLSKCCC